MTLFCENTDKNKECSDFLYLGSFEINLDLSDEYTCVSLHDFGTNLEACLFSNNTFIRHNIISDGTEDWRMFDLDNLQ